MRSPTVRKSSRRESIWRARKSRLREPRAPSCRRSTAFADVNNAGLTGTPNALCPPGVSFCQPLPYFVGGTGNLFGQIFRRNFPNYSAGLSLNIPFRNRAAQADYVDDMLTLRQTELQFQRAENDVKVQVRNAVVSLQQARARYENAVASRKLAEQTLDAEQMRFKFGESTIATVVQSQRDLATNQTAEIQSIANYTHAKIAFDQALGQTLEVNHVSIEEATAGRVRKRIHDPERASESGEHCDEYAPSCRIYRRMGLPDLPTTGPAALRRAATK